MANKYYNIKKLLDGYGRIYRVIIGQYARCVIMDNDNYLITRKSDGSLTKIEIEKNVLMSDDKIIRVHRALPVDEPHYYIIEQYQTVNPDDIRGKAWCTICKTTDFATAKRFVFAHNIGDKEFQSALIRRFNRFDCPVSWD